MSVTIDEFATIFSKGFWSDLGTLLHMLETNGWTIDDVRPFIRLIDKNKNGIRCPVCGKPLRYDNCCKNRGHFVCSCGYVE